MLKESLANRVDNQKLLNTIQKLRLARSPDREQYTSYYDEDPMEGIQWENLKGRIFDLGEEFRKATGTHRVFTEVNAWWNLYGFQNHHCWHAHPNALFAGTFYVNVPQGSRSIQFKHPLETLIQSWDSNAFGDTRWSQFIEIHPSEGDLLIWPSWLEHTVPEIKNANQGLNRCTISFNLI